MARETTFTIGYAGRTITEFVRVLRDAGVDRVVDVRELPLSRKKGFSKTALAVALSKANIEYVHLRAAGNPFRDQKADVAKCLALYAGYVDEHAEVVEGVEAAVRGQRAALLCFEATADECHRGVIAARLRARDPRRQIRHL